jgi:hypothetical protein
MAKQILETEHAKVFLDVVFGVVIALPMAQLPQLVQGLALAPSHAALWTPVLLLTSAILFCAFYWLEVRRFIEEQIRFNEAVMKLHNRSLELINFSLVRLVGSLFAIMLVAAMLKYAELNLFEAFLISSAIFWLLDFGGNVEGHLLYKKHKESYDLMQQNCPPELVSYVGRFVGKSFFFFWLDGLFTMVVCVALVWVDYVRKVGGEPVKYRFGASIGILTLTLFRHLFWRTTIYDWKKGIK